MQKESTEKLREIKDSWLQSDTWHPNMLASRAVRTGVFHAVPMGQLGSCLFLTCSPFQFKCTLNAQMLRL